MALTTVAKQRLQQSFAAQPGLDWKTESKFFINIDGSTQLLLKKSDGRQIIEVLPASTTAFVDTIVENAELITEYDEWYDANNPKKIQVSQLDDAIAAISAAIVAEDTRAAAAVPVYDPTTNAWYNDLVTQKSALTAIRDGV